MKFNEKYFEEEVEAWAEKLKKTNKSIKNQPNVYRATVRNLVDFVRIAWNAFKKKPRSIVHK